MVDATLVFSIVAGIIAFGFAGEIFFKKTGISYFLFLIFIGIILGPALNVFPREPLIPALGIFAELTLIMVLFYSGMDMRIREVIGSSSRTLVQVVLYVIPSTIAIGVLSHFLFGWDFVQSLIFGSIIGGETTAAVVVPLSRSLGFKEKTMTFLTLESLMNSIFSIVLFSTFSNLYLSGNASLGAALSTITANFAVGIFLGAALSIIWLLLLKHLKKFKYTYVFTLGLLFATYSIVQVVGGNGLLGVLIFGLFIGNSGTVMSFFKKRLSIHSLQKQLKNFQSELSFLMETFFFVFLGLTFIINPSQVVNNLLLGLFFLAVLLVFRISAVEISTRNSEMSKDKIPIVLICAQGLTPATLAIVALSEGLPLANTFLNLVVYVIVLTNIVTTVGAVWIARKFNSQKTLNH